MGLDRETARQPVVGQITPGGSVGRCGVINASDVNGQEVDQIACEGVVVDPPERRARHWGG
jgi:hypothetical protein